MDLHAPLGKRPSGNRRILPVAVASVLFAGVAALSALLFQADPHGGHPYAVAMVPAEPASKASPASAESDLMPTASIGGKGVEIKGRAGDVTRIENGVKITSPSEAERAAPRETRPMIIDVSKALDEGARKSMFRDRAKVAPPGGTTRTAPAAGIVRPRVAIFVGGMGLSESATRTATEIMPPAVALAFVPVDSKVPASVATARSKGHEVLLQLPMQDGQGPVVAPHALRAGGSPGETASDIEWLMSRFDGYVGMTNLLGASVTGNTTAMTSVLKAAQQRGLFYVDDGTSKHSVTASVAQTIGMRPLQADVVLDATNDPAAVRANLDRLAAIARKKGTAIGVANGLSDHLASIARFAADLDSKGLSLVPVSSLARREASLATTR